MLSVVLLNVIAPSEPNFNFNSTFLYHIQSNKGTFQMIKFKSSNHRIANTETLSTKNEIQKLNI